MDNASKWHAMGLLSMAMETCTLPTRIRDNDSTGFLGRLDDMVTLLNVSGNQKIANLAMSVYQTEMEKKTSDYSLLPQRDSASKIELSWDSGGTRIKGRKINNDGHVFAEAEVLRGFSEEQVAEGTASSSRTNQKTDQRTAQRKAQLEHDRQDVIIGRWVLLFICAQSWCVSPPPRLQYFMATGLQGRMWRAGLAKKRDYRCPVASVFCEVFRWIPSLICVATSLLGDWCANRLT